MTAHHVADGKTPLSELSLVDKKEDDPSPPYTESVPSTNNGPPKLHILGATWGGVNVTPEITGMVKLDKSGELETVKLNMHTLHTALLPDPAITVIKTLTVLYRYDNDAVMQVLNATQFAPQIFVEITPSAHVDKTKGCIPNFFTRLQGTAWRDGEVEILAVLYGPTRITTPSVLEELARLFEGRRGQIRTTTGFFKTDSWIGMRKSWTVYFRYLNSGTGRVQCVTGMEDGALEGAWGREL